MPETPGSEFWRSLKPIERVFRPGALAELYHSKVADADERYFVPFSETVSSRPLWISPQRNMWADVLMARRAGLVNGDGPVPALGRFLGDARLHGHGHS